MVTFVKGRSAVDAWQEGASLISATQGHAVTNLITEIEDPTYCDKDWFSRFDPKSVGGADRLSVVAKVLFPGLSRRGGEDRLAYYSRCAQYLQRGLNQRRLHSAWGSTYFQRLVSLDGSENQLERAIQVLSTWQVRSLTSIVAHTSSPTVDSLRKRGSPCLQFLEILWREDGALDLVAVYRNHDFLNKALGNFIGLGRLLHFIASEGRKSPGRVVCHSVNAYCVEIGRLRNLVAR